MVLGPTLVLKCFKLQYYYHHLKFISSIIVNILRSNNLPSSSEVKLDFVGFMAVSICLTLLIHHILISTLLKKNEGVVGENNDVEPAMLSNLTPA